MPILQIHPAERKGARLVIGLAGVSGGGKTYSALQLAYGLTNKQAGKIGLLDTENRRGSLYADSLPNGERFLIGDLVPPFSPQRYIDAIKEFEKMGIEVLIIDSYTHLFEGEGGLEDIAAEGGRMPDWKTAKAQNKKFVNTLLMSPLHIIVCIRARERVKIEEQPDKKKVFVPLGLQPIAEKNFIFELTVSLMLHDQGARQDVIKCPAALQPILGRGSGYLTIEDGLAVRQWINEGDANKQEEEFWRSHLTTQAEEGIEALRKAWEECPIAIRHKLGGKQLLEALKLRAEECDSQQEGEGKVESATSSDTR